MILRSPTLRNLAAAVAAVALGLSPAGAQIIGPACPAIFDPAPLPPNAAPPDTFADPVLFAPNPAASNDYHWMHSSGELRGESDRSRCGGARPALSPNQKDEGDKKDVKDKHQRQKTLSHRCPCSPFCPLGP
jgi:hypothetical protein